MIGTDPKRYKTSKDTTSFNFKNQLKPKIFLKIYTNSFYFPYTNFSMISGFRFRFHRILFLTSYFYQEKLSLNISINLGSSEQFSKIFESDFEMRKSLESLGNLVEKSRQISINSSYFPYTKFSMISGFRFRFHRILFFTSYFY